MKKIDVRKVVVGWAVVSMMCIAPGFGLRAQDNPGLIPQEKNGKWGYVNQAGKTVVSFRYEAAEAFSEGLALVRLKGKWGYVNERGKELIPLIYKNAGDFSEGVAIVQLNNQSVFIDRTGKVVSSFYDKIGEFSADGLAKVESGTKTGFIDRTGKEVCPLSDNINDFFTDGVARIELDKKFGYMDVNGRLVTALYNQIGKFSEGLAAVNKEDKIGFIDRFGNETIPPKFDTKLEGKNSPFVPSTGVLNFKSIMKNDTVIHSQTLHISNFQFTNGRIKVLLNGKFGIIDKAGNEVVPFKYDLIGEFSDDGKAIVQLGEDIKYMDENGVESDLTSRWPDFPIKWNEDKITIVDLKISRKDNKTAIVLYGMGLNPLAMTVGSKGLEAEKMPVVIFTADGQEHTSNRGSVGILSMSYYYETSAEPETVFIFMKDNPDEKIQIHCK